MACKIDLTVQLPSELLRSLAGVKGFDEETFIKVHESGEQVTSIRVNPFKSSMVNGQWSNIHDSPLTIHEKIPWTEYGYYLAKVLPSLSILFFMPVVIMFRKQAVCFWNRH